ncbi:unnamed protein product, partial [Aphanomyces euteiches]
ATLRNKTIRDRKTTTTPQSMVMMCMVLLVKNLWGTEAMDNMDPVETRMGVLVVDMATMAADMATMVVMVLTAMAEASVVDTLITLAVVALDATVEDTAI